MTVYLIDGNSYAYRAFYAIRELSTSRGFSTNAIYGFTNMLLKIIREKKPDGIVVTFDSSVPTKRHAIFEKYKAHRPETPHGLVEQMPYIKKLISAFHIKIFEMPGYEADDIIGTVSQRLASKGISVFIVTADKDMLQLVDSNIKIYDPVKDKILNDEYVKDKFGVGPERITEFMALTGDAVDNIPGIKGVGEKTAKELLSNVSSLEELLGNTNLVKKEKLRRLVAENTDIVRLSQRLATIDTSVPLDFQMEEIGLKEPDWPRLLSLFREFEFNSLVKLIPTGTPRKREFETVFSLNRLEEIAGIIESAIGREFSFHVESSAGTISDPLTDRPVGIALAIDKDHSIYVPLSHSYPGVPPQIEKEDTVRILSPIFGNEQISKIGHNLKHEILMLKRQGISLKGTLFDTMIASYLINPNRQTLNLEEVTLEYLSRREKSLNEIIGKRKSLAEVPIDEAASYVANAVTTTFELKELLFAMLEEENLERVYFDIEMPLIHVLADMEEAGVKIDSEMLKHIAKELERELDAIQKRIYFLAGEEFNINSPKQLSIVLFQNLGFQPTKKTKTGFSTELSVLEELAESHDLPRELLNYRSLNKLKTTYVDTLPQIVNPTTRRIHTTFNQTATATGRLSSSEPNLQNIPVRGNWGKRIRETIIAEDGNILLSADYSQVELRILAHLSQDKGLLDAFRNDLDVHTRTASELFGIPPDKVTSDMRRIAKTVNFGVIYGISPFGLSETLSISREEARKYIERYFERHPGVKMYIEEVIESAKRNGYVVTLFGRRRSIPELKNQNSAIRQQGERLAINSPIQGTAADIIKIAMTRIWRSFRDQGVKAKMILQVHDELLFELPLNELDRTRKVVREKMEKAVELSVSVKVEIGHGKNWAEAH
ncbi:MAG: DNA polymerase I [Nitrospirae bacterium RBG_13_43_8]|nr:MAG: DNA polymerase I [Nitrospirae bacterium RBG_13_43_8]